MFNSHGSVQLPRKLYGIRWFLLWLIRLLYYMYFGMYLLCLRDTLPTV